MAPSSRWNLAIVVSSRFFFQLNDGEQLYANILPGNFSRIASANLNRFNGPEGQAFDGGKRLVLGGRSYERGLSFRSRTSVVYRLPKDGRRFLASVGIDDRAGDTGNVRLVISGDNRTLFDETVDGGQTPVELSLDVAGIRRLTILVDYGEGLDIGDFLNLCNARITK